MLCRDRTASEDLVAEALARAWPKWREGSVDDLVPYLRRSVCNLALKGRYRQFLARRYEEQMDAMLDRSTPHEHLAASLDLTRAAPRLPLKQRAVILLRYLKDLSEAEVAEVLGISPGTVKSRASRALHTLRKICEERPDV